MRGIVKNIIFISCTTLVNFLFSQQDYSKWQLIDNGYVDFTTKKTQFINQSNFELPWLYQGKIDSIKAIPCGYNQEYRYSFVQDTNGSLMYYSDFSGVYSNRSGILFKSYYMNELTSICLNYGNYYKIPGKPGFNYCSGISVDTIENYGYSNCVRFGKSNDYGVYIWDYLSNGARLLHLKYDKILGDTIISSSILANAGQLTSVTCGPNDSTFWIVSILKNMHTINVYLWSSNNIILTQSLEIGDTSHLFSYANRIKFSPDNTKMVLLKRYKNSSRIFHNRSESKNTSYIFDFDSKNGIISNRKQIPIYGSDFVFSPNSKLLYISDLNTTYNISNIDSSLVHTPFRSLYRLNIQSKAIDLVLKDSSSLVNMQLMPDGNIYLNNYPDLNLKYAFNRLENCNDTQSVNFKKVYSNISYDGGVGNKIYVRDAFLFCPEILACKCFEKEQKSNVLESCFNDTLVIKNKFKKYDSIEVDWGDGSSNVYNGICNTLNHYYSKSGKYITTTNYRSVFQEFTQIDTIIYLKKNSAAILKDTFFCQSDSLLIDLNHYDSNLVWKGVENPKYRVNRSGDYKYHYRDNWCNYEDSIIVNERLQPWKPTFHDTVICSDKNVSIVVPKNLTIIWNNNPTDSAKNKNINLTGKYFLNYSDGICKFKDSIFVTVSSSMNLEVFQIDTNICHLFTPLEFQILGDFKKMKTVTWNSEVTNSFRYSTNHLMEIRITATDTYGCLENVDITPSSRCNPHVFIPNAFTPNSSGPDANEFFKPVIKDCKIKSFKIYNRWGLKIFDNPNNTGWDGMIENNYAPEGVYIYEIEIITKLNNVNHVNRYFGNFQLLK